ncbi:hypothetical protein G7046_g7420 [Stylonectria norvegica]|nr:hypothetical protein G7046_g7420 [Stylonectria norvegica]
MAEDPIFLRIPAEIRMLIYQYLLHNNGSKTIAIRNKSRWEVQGKEKRRRSVYPIMERTFARLSYETTYCADSVEEDDNDRNLHTAIMCTNRRIREEASCYLYGRHSFHFGENLEAVVPFLNDKTPTTRDLVREITLYKSSPTASPGSYEWAGICRFLRNLRWLDKLTLVIEGARPRRAWDGPQELSVSDFRLLYSTRHESLEWARELASVKTIGEIEIVSDIHHLPDPETNMMLVLAAFSASIETTLVDFLRDDLGIPARVGKGTYCGAGAFGHGRQNGSTDHLRAARRSIMDDGPRGAASAETATARLQGGLQGQQWIGGPSGKVRYLAVYLSPPNRRHRAAPRISDKAISIDSIPPTSCAPIFNLNSNDLSSIAVSCSQVDVSIDRQLLRKLFQATPAFIRIARPGDAMATPAPPEDQARLLEDALVAVRQQTSLMRKCLDTPGKLMDALKCCQSRHRQPKLTSSLLPSSTLVSELRTSNLGPKQYYELYMAVFDALRYLSVHLRENHPVNHLADLYELVQYAGNIIPRLYLMITVGTAYMAIEDAPVKELMKDMMDMSRGVQHPIRGLFLRYYLSGQARDYLPTGEGDGPEGNLSDSINFVLTNFVEMNKLWVRLQHQGHSREREQRVRERKELQLLVGSNIVRLSQLVDLETYKSGILAPLLEQVVQCRDVLAQEYLLEVITQVFPDEFHLHTLDQILGAVSRLNPHVNVKAIVIGLMDRLSEYAERDGPNEKGPGKEKAEAEALATLLEKVKLQKDAPAAPSDSGSPAASATTPDLATDATSKATSKSSEGDESASANGEQSEDGAEDSTKAESINDDASTVVEEPTPSIAETEATAVNGAEESITDSVHLYEVFFAQVKNLVEAQHLPVPDIIALLVSLSNLALNIYPERLDYVDQILAFATAKVQENINNPDLHSPPAQQSLLALLQAPLDRYVSIFTALSLPTYVPMFQSQSYPTRRAVAGGVARSLLKNQTKITTTEQLENVLEVLKVLIKEGTQPSQGYPSVAARRPVETDETMEEQGWLARITHLLQAADNDTQFKLLQMTRKAYSEGNERIRTTTPPLLTACMKLAKRFKDREHYEDNWETQSNALFKFMHSALSTLYTRVNGSGAAEMALRLFCAAGQTADMTGFEEVAYEFFAQAFTVYEEAVSDSKAQFQAVCVIATALHQTRNFGKENYDTLITKCAQHGSKLLRKPDQCRAVYLASHLWWAMPITTNGESEETELYRDGKRVLECLQRALRVADSCMETATSIELFVEILDRYVYYFDQQNESVTTKYLNGLIELIHSNLAGNQQDSASIDSSRKHFHQTLENIRSRQYEGVVLDAN